MNVNIVSNTDNKLLDRKEIVAEVGFDAATPKRLQIKEAVSHKIGANPELMVLRKVASSFGKHSVTVTAYAYSSKELLMATEPIYVKVREGMMPKPEKKKKAAPAPTKKA